MALFQESRSSLSTDFRQVSLPPVLYVPSCTPEKQDMPAWRASGTHVAAGEPLTDPAIDQRGRAVIAPVAGIVGQAAIVRIADGRLVHAIDLHVEQANDAPADDSPNDAALREERLLSAAPDELPQWIDRLARLGVAADRWTCPDLLGQLRHAAGRKIDSVICSVLDSDPWLAVNQQMAMSCGDDLAAGIGLLSRLTGASRTWAMIDQAAGPEAFISLAASALHFAGQLRLAPIENDYPQTNPTLLVYAVTRRRLVPGELPTERGVVLIDAAAAVAVGRAARQNLWVSYVPMIIYDQPADRAHRLAVTPGTTLGAVLDHVNIPIAVREVYAGSPLRQLRCQANDVISAAGELTFFVAPPQPRIPATPCIRCGWCIEGCPTRCRPAGLLEAAQRQDLDLARRNGLEACIECGLCTYVCPSRLPILEGIRTLK
jgi:Na+-translocating ferredoxin:NAD+ oxidoreductase RnfC subunit